MITRGTTPVIKYTFTTVNPSNITAVLSVRQGSVLIVKDSTDDHYSVNTSATPKYVQWMLEEDDTLALKPGLEAQVQMRYTDGTLTYATPITKENVADILYDGWTAPEGEE